MALRVHKLPSLAAVVTTIANELEYYDNFKDILYSCGSIVELIDKYLSAEMIAAELNIPFDCMCEVIDYYGDSEILESLKDCISSYDTSPDENIFTYCIND